MTTNGLRYIQIHNNAVGESVVANFIQIVKHINGKINLADLFTKEDKDCAHFISICDILVQDIPKHSMKVNDTSPSRFVNN